MAWNVVHNFPEAKDTYEVPIDYPTVGYDTIIASWFTDIFTSILAMQDSLLALIDAVPAGADTQVQYNDGGDMAGDANFVWDKVEKTLTIKCAEDLNGLKILDHENNIVAIFGVDAPAIYVTFKFLEEVLFLKRVECEDDIEITENTKGLILSSPNDSRFRLEVSDGGVLSTEAL